MLEYWFPLADIPRTRELGTWCDGVTELEIISNARRIFLVNGVGWFPHFLAPFQLEFHFLRRRETCPERILLRLGFRNELVAANACVSSQRLRRWQLSKRPRRNQDWEVAVELTPGDT